MNNTVKIVIEDIKELLNGSRPLANLTDEKGDPCYYNIEPLEDDFERTAELSQCFARCFSDTLHELESYGMEDSFFDELAEVDWLTAGLNAEKGDFGVMIKEILAFEIRVNEWCVQGKSNQDD